MTCMVTRAVHLEIAHSLSCDSFLMAVQRFIDRRGRPTMIRSDNGTNFVAGRKVLSPDRALPEEEFARGIADKGIEWIFNQPHAPHFGGVWERLVRSAKNALLVALGDQSVTDELLITVITDIESLLNSKPLTHGSLHPDDDEPLTPNHFIFGRPSPYVPLCQADVNDVLSKEHVKITQALVHKFWVRWMREYVPNLTERRKWTTSRPNLQANDLVLIVDETQPRGTWPIGRVVEAIAGQDGVVRKAKVKIKNSEYCYACFIFWASVLLVSTVQREKY